MSLDDDLSGSLKDHEPSPSDDSSHRSIAAGIKRLLLRDLRRMPDHAVRRYQQKSGRFEGRTGRKTGLSNSR